jgi:hypothetical protein
MTKLKDWATKFCATVLEDDEARKAYKKVAEGVAVLVRVGSNKLTTTRILTLTSALTSTVKDALEAKNAIAK